MPCPAVLVTLATLTMMLTCGAAAADVPGESHDVSGPPRSTAARPASPPSVRKGDVKVDTTVEPTVDALCRAAVALALVEPDRARGFISRARLAGWLPEVHFRVYRRFARTEGLTFADMGAGAGTIAPVDIDAVDDVRYEWRASWDLSRMVFNPDELQAHFEALRMADVRRDIQSLVIKLYFERRRLVSGEEPGENHSPGGSASSDATAMEKRWIRVTEIGAQLDALTGGAFSAGTARPQAAAPR